MEKPNDYEQELNKLLIEALKLEEKATLDLKTAKFLDKQAKKLEKIIKNVSSTKGETEDAIEKLKILHGRIRRELNENDSTMTRVEKEIIDIIQLIKKESS